MNVIGSGLASKRKVKIDKEAELIILNSFGKAVKLPFSFSFGNK